jgi:hypothetical protein
MAFSCFIRQADCCIISGFKLSATQISATTQRQSRWSLYPARGGQLEFWRIYFFELQSADVAKATASICNAAGWKKKETKITWSSRAGYNPLIETRGYKTRDVISLLTPRFCHALKSILHLLL